MSPEFDRLDEKLDKVADSLSDLNARLAAIQTDLAYHIRRTDLLEGRFESLDKDVTKLRGFFAVGGWVVGIAATMMSIISKLGLF